MASSAAAHAVQIARKSRFSIGSYCLLVAALFAFGAACHHDRLTAVEFVNADDDDAVLDDLEARPDGAFTVLDLETPDGSGQTVHPDHVAMSSWRPSQFLVVTPYAFSNNTLENPSLYALKPDFSWAPFGNLRNPIARPTSGYLSDPDAVAVPEKRELRIYYRQVTTDNEIHMVSTKDGVHFNEPAMVATAPNHGIVSPAIVRRAADNWIMWSVNAGGGGCTAPSTTVEVRYSSDGAKWSPPEPVALNAPVGFVWHLDVQWIPSYSEYWALFNVKDDRSCNTAALFFARSPDGITWETYPVPVLERGAIPEFTDVVYRATFSYNRASDRIRFWYSGARYEGGRYVWRTAYQRRSRLSVFTSLGWGSGASRSLALFARRPGVPALLDGP